MTEKRPTLAARKKMTAAAFKWEFRDVKNVSKLEDLCDRVGAILAVGGSFPNLLTGEWRELCGLKAERD